MDAFELFDLGDALVETKGAPNHPALDSVLSRF
jgi:hypothetical protein